MSERARKIKLKHIRTKMNEKRKAAKAQSEKQQAFLLLL